MILFGSYARGDWVEDLESGYRSDYDLLAVVNVHNFGEENDVWVAIDERLTREFAITHRVGAPAKIIAHSLTDINDKLARGLPFFADIARDGIVLYEERGYPLAEPKPLTPEAARQQAQLHFDQWFPTATDLILGAEFYRRHGNLKLATFNLHQATECLYHCVLLVVTLYSPKSHRLSMLRTHAERIDPRLIVAWPRDSKFARRCFSRLDRAYVDARYSPHYEIAMAEFAWLVDHINSLQSVVKQVCTERLMQQDRKLNPSATIHWGWLDAWKDSIVLLELRPHHRLAEYHVGTQAHAADGFVNFLKARGGTPISPPKTWTGQDQVMTTNIMAGDPKHSVVDSVLWSQVHSNVYLFTTVVLPASGAVNPTRAGVALAIRAACHIVGVKCTGLHPFPISSPLSLSAPSRIPPSRRKPNGRARNR